MVDLHLNIDGDRIGSQTMRAVLRDDLAELRETGRRIEAGQDVWVSWAIRSGGQVVEAGGDDLHVIVPASALQEVERVRDQYRDATGQTCTVGVGRTLSESAKALVVGKVRGRDRVVLYGRDVEAEYRAVAGRTDADKYGQLEKGWSQKFEHPSGYVVPEKGFHHVRYDYQHDNVVLRHYRGLVPSDYDRDVGGLRWTKELEDRLRDDGWVGVGHGSTKKMVAQTISSRHDIISDPQHPSTQKVRELVRGHWTAPSFEVTTEHGPALYSTKHFIGSGRLVPFDPVRHDPNYKSEAGLEKATPPAGQTTPARPEIQQSQHSPAEALRALQAEERPPPPDVPSDQMSPLDAELTALLDQHADQADQAEQGSREADQVRQRVAAALRDVQASVSVLSALQQADPRAYRAVRELASSVIELARLAKDELGAETRSPADFFEHSLPAQLAAEGYGAHVAHWPDHQVVVVHRGGHLVGQMERLSDGRVTQSWVSTPRAGLVDAAATLLAEHVSGGHAPLDGWSNPTRAAVRKGGLANQPAAPEPPHPEPAGSDVTTPSPSYHHGATQKPKGAVTHQNRNIWVRQGGGQDNSNRTLMVQFSSDLLQGGREPDRADHYYDKLYRSREGYRRPDDFWEVPQWQAHLARSVPNADSYVVRDPEEAIRFANRAGYRNVAFSALDVNSGLVRDFATRYRGRVAVGGYTDMRQLSGLENVRVHPTVQDFVESEGLPYQPGYDYRHFSGTSTIPRITLSDGCRHNCSYCTIPKMIDEKSRDEVMDQADQFGQHFPSELVYVNDKTFGQAANHRLLPEVYDRIKSKNPNFKGFVIQTTASQLGKLDPEFLKRAGVRHVELGIETVNDPILRAHRKPATEKTIEAAATKLRQAGISLIPNIMVGLPGEDETSYGRTLDWLRRNRDIISHVNAYNLAVYDNTPLGTKLRVLSDQDRDENSPVKSWYQDPAVHERFRDELFRFANEQLERVPFRKSELGKAEGLVKARMRLPRARPARPHRVVLPVGTQLDGEQKVKVQHVDGSTSWKQVRAGVVMSQDPARHGTSSRTPESR